MLLSPSWELPFSEVIDWTKAAIVADERLSLQVAQACLGVGVDPGNGKPVESQPLAVSILIPILIYV